MSCYPSLFSYRQFFNLSLFAILFLGAGFNVQGQNAVPEFISQPEVSAPNHSDYSYHFSARDEDGEDEISFEVFNKPEWLDFTDNGNGAGVLTGRPDDSDYGDYTFYLDVRDAESYSRQTIRLEVTNQPPVFLTTPVIQAPNHLQYTYSFNVSDEDAGDEIQFEVFNLPLWLKLVDNGDGTGVLIGTPDETDFGDYTFYLDARDGASYVRQTIRIEVTNTIPVFDQEPMVDVSNHMPYVYHFGTSDPDPGDNTFFEVFNAPSWLSLTDNQDASGVLSGVPGDADYGDHTFYLDVRDGAGYSRQTVRMAVNNEEPVFNTTPVSSVFNHEFYSYAFSVTDPDLCDIIHFETFNLPDWLTLVDHGDGTGEIKGVPGDADFGDYTFYLDARDEADYTRQVVRLEVENSEPVFQSEPIVEAPVNSPYFYNFSVLDSDLDDVIHFEHFNLPSWLTFTDHGDGTGILKGNPTTSDYGDYTFYLDARDGVSYRRQSIRIEVTENPFYFTSEPVFEAIADQNYSYSFSINDGSVSGFTIESKPDWLQLSNIGAGSGILSGTPVASDLYNPAPVILKATSEGVTSVQEFFIKNGGDTNIEPVFNPSYIPQIGVGRDFSIIVSAFDADGDALTIGNSANDLPSVLELMQSSVGNGEIASVITGKLSENRSYTFTLDVSDGQRTSFKEYTIEVGDINSAPQLMGNGNRTLTLGDSYSYTIWATDANQDEMEISYSGDLPPGLELEATTSSECGANALLSGIITEPGSYTFSLLVSDGFTTSPQEITINVINPNSKPVFTSRSTISVLRSEVFEFPIVAYDADEEVLVINNITSLPTGIVLQSTENDGDGKAVAILSGSLSTESITPILFEVSDGTHTVQQTLQIMVKHRPEFIGLSFYSFEPEESISLPIQFQDMDGDNMTIQVIGSVPPGLNLSTVVNNGNGIATANLNGAINFSGVYFLTVEANDGEYSTKHIIQINVSNNLGCTGPQLIDGIHYQLNDDNTATVIALPNDEVYNGDVVIPPTVNCGEQEYTVTEIGANAFNGCDDLLSVSFPETLLVINSNAFRACTNLTTLTLPESIVTIGDEAFVHCTRLSGSLTIPDKVTTIGSRAFFNCTGFTGSLTIGNEVKTIGNGAFGGCTGFGGSLVIGHSVTNIGSGAFSGCSGFSNSLSIPDSVVTIGDNAFNLCRGLSGSLTLGNSLTTIGDNAFRRCHGLTGALNIPASVLNIGTSAFENCIGLSCAVIPSSVLSIGLNSFSSMSSLNELIFLSLTPANITGSGTFIEESKPIYVPDASLGTYQDAWGSNYNLQPFSNIINDLSVEQFAIGDEFHYEFGSVVNGCMQYTISGLPSWLPADGAAGIIEGTLEEPGEYEFTITAMQEGHQLASKTIQFEVIDPNGGCTGPQLIDGIHYQLNDDNTATVIALPNDEMYSGHVVIPPIVECGGQDYTVTEIGSESFGDLHLHNTSLLSVDLPNTITEIDFSAFMWCSNLTSITFPELLTYIDLEAFRGCSNLVDVTFLGNNLKDIDVAAFESTAISCFSLPNSVERMGGRILRYSPLQTVLLGESLQEIYDYVLFEDDNSILNEIILLAPIPPSVVGFGFDASVPIYVPDDSYEAYLMDDAWGLREIRMLSAYFTPTVVPVDPYVGEWFEYRFTTNAESCVNISIPGKPGWLNYSEPVVNEDGKLEHILSGIAPDIPESYSFDVLASMQGNQFATHRVAFEVVANPCVGEAPEVTIVRENEGALICPGESIRLEAYEAAGNLDHYIFGWYNSSNTLLKESSQNYLDIEDVEGSSLGDYRVRLIDPEINCDGFGSYTLSSDVFYNTPAVSVSDLRPTTCLNSADGEATITISGSDETYSYTLSRNGQIVETVSTVGSGDAYDFAALRQGSYLLSGTTVNGCEFRHSFTIQNGGPRFTEVCTHLLPMDLSPEEEVASEFSFIVHRRRWISNGFDYNILDSSGEKVFSEDKSGSYGTNATASFTYVHGENYTLQIYENGAECEESSIQLRFSNLSPRLSAPSEVHRCFEGQNVTLTGHASFNFNNCTEANLSPTVDLLREVEGEFMEPVEVSYEVINKNNISISSNSENHPAGRYLLRFSIDDAYYGTTQQEKIIEIIEDEMIDVTVEAFTVTCPGGNDGRLEARVKGGVPPYKYYWYDEGEELVSSSSVATMLLPGDYTLKITDSRDCDMEESSGPYTVYDKEPWGDISVTLPDSYSDNCFVEAEITGVEENMTYTFEWVQVSYKKMVRLIDNSLVEDEVYTQSTSVVWTDKVFVPEGSNSALSISDDYYVEPGYSYYIIVRDENGCMVHSRDQETPLFHLHEPGTPFLLEPIEVEREYNLVFAWKTRVHEVEDDLPPAIGETNGPTIAAASMAQDMKQQALECAAIAGKAAAATFEDICLSKDMLSDRLTLEYENGSYHYTLYYFDRAGNLIKTVPPKGINLYDGGRRWDGHSMETEYRYNSLGQLIWQNTPDGGQTQFLYNNAGQLRFSQNAQQAEDNTFSYTKYDELGRIRETGQGDFGHRDIPFYRWKYLVDNADDIFADDMVVSLDEQFPQADIDQEAIGQKTVTWYGQESGVLNQGHPQRYLLNRVSHTAHTNTNGETITTYFSYDPHGNVEWMVQELPLLGESIIDYEYDLISGNVTQVAFNQGKPDQFFHRYLYDEDNRIREVKTSKDGYVWESDARYSYFKHGPLKRMELGEDNVQGLDYTYTIQGWLKAINHPSLSGNIDPGDDGTFNSAGSDAFGMILSYYEGDYRNMHSTFDPESTTYNAVNPMEDRGLYNGNIAAWTHSTATSNSFGGLDKGSIFGQQFVYDKLNRIKESRFNDLVSGVWQPVDDFSSSYEYDSNGNITRLYRTSNQGNAPMDDLEYHYMDGGNKLLYVEDRVPYSDFENDVDDQMFGNYRYDEIGNLISDQQETIHHIEWTVHGKVASISKRDDSEIAFTYDAQGNRTTKKVTLPGGLVTTTYYVRDAQGNVLSIYRGTDEPAIREDATGYDHVITLSEQPIYGSSRLGLRRGNGLEVRRINFPRYGDPEVVDDSKYNELGNLMSATISNQGAFVTAAQAFPGISASLKALTEDSYSFTLSTNLPTTAGTMKYNLLQDNTNSVWAGEAGRSGSWSHTLTAGAETSDYQLSVSQKSSIFDQPIARHLYDKQYELTDHLGNVRAVVSAGLEYNPVGKHVNPRVIATNTYYPFGMLIGSLSGNSEGYRYGFNGKEKDDQGEWGMTHYDYGFRIFNPGLVRFLSVDPLTKEYPWYTPYQFAGNKPIWAIDLDGLEEYYYFSEQVENNGITKLNKVYAWTIYERYNPISKTLEKIESESWTLLEKSKNHSFSRIFESKESLMQFGTSDNPFKYLYEIFVPMPQEFKYDFFSDILLGTVTKNQLHFDGSKGLGTLIDSYNHWKESKSTSINVIVGSFKSLDNAAKYASEIGGEVLDRSDDGFHRVSVGKYTLDEFIEALKHRNRLNEDDKDAWLLRTNEIKKH